MTRYEDAEVGRVCFVWGKCALSLYVRFGVVGRMLGVYDSYIRKSK